MEKQQKEGTKKEEASSKKNIQHIKINFHMFIVITIHTFKDKSMYGRATLVKQRPCFLTRRFLLQRCYFFFISFLFCCAAFFCTDTCTDVFTQIHFTSFIHIDYMRHIVWLVAEKQRDVVYFFCLSHTVSLCYVLSNVK